MDRTLAQTPWPVPVGFLGLLCFACGPADQASEAPSVQIDHVIVAVGDLQTGMDAFEELTGVRPVFGGDHPGRGTRNALVSLGSRVYLEVLAPQEAEEPGEDLTGLVGLTELTPMGWGASTTDMDATLAQLRNAGFTAPEPMPGSRVTPDGGLLQWRTGGISDPILVGAPFFIEWDVDSPHPATTSPQGCEIETLRIFSPDATALEDLFRLLELPVEIEASMDGAEPYEMTLRCPTGTVILR